MAGPISRELTDPIPRAESSGRALGVGVALALVLAAIAAAAYAFTRGGDDGRAAAPPSATANPNVAPIDAAAAAAPDALLAAATGPRDAGARRGRDAGVRHVTSKPRAPAADPRVAAHLARAESARNERRWLKVIAEADMALRIEPSHKRAAFLMGEAQLESGDKSNACKYLRKAGRRWGARTLYKTARCGD